MDTFCTSEGESCSHRQRNKMSLRDRLSIEDAIVPLKRFVECNSATKTQGVLFVKGFFTQRARRTDAKGRDYIVPVVEINSCASALHDSSPNTTALRSLPMFVVSSSSDTPLAVVKKHIPRRCHRSAPPRGIAPPPPPASPQACSTTAS